jgi:hypothetical protein
VPLARLAADGVIHGAGKSLSIGQAAVIESQNTSPA